LLIFRFLDFRFSKIHHGDTEHRGTAGPSLRSG
jgi:hypothetical protein